jgi:integrase
MYHLERQEIKRLFEVAYNKNRLHHLAFVTAFFHGARVSELLKIVGADIQDGQLSITRLKGAGKKGKKRHKTTLQPIHADADPLFDESPLIAIAAANPKGRLFPFCRQRMDQVIKEYGEIAGLHRDKLHMHVLRHSLGVVVWRATHEVSAVKEILGHHVVTSSLVYMQTDATAKANAVLSKAFSVGGD